jgi:hypothetical protein
MPKPKRRAVKLPAAARTASVAKHRGALANAIHDFFVLKVGAIAATAAELYARATKADDDKIKRILSDLGLDDWGALSDAVQTSLIAAYVEGGDAAIRALGREGGSVFDVVNEEALAYAKSRGAELVGMKWKDGVLIENPRAEWAINESTRDGLRDLIAKAFDEGLSPAQLSEEIADSYLFSTARADLISRTELSFAHIQGELESMRASGVVSGKQLVPGDGHEEDECDDYFDTVYDLDSEEGDPPIHPRCTCTLVYVMAEEEEAA